MSSKLVATCVTHFNYRELPLPDDNHDDDNHDDGDNGDDDDTEDYDEGKFAWEIETSWNH